MSFMLWECIWHIIEWNAFFLTCSYDHEFLISFCTTLFNKMIILGFTNVLVSKHLLSPSRIRYYCDMHCYVLFLLGCVLWSLYRFHDVLSLYIKFSCPFFWAHTHKCIILLLRVYSMVRISWYTASLYHSLFNQPKEIIIAWSYTKSSRLYFTE